MEKRLTLLLILLFVNPLLFVPKTFCQETQPKTIIVPDDFLTISTAIGNAATGDTVYVRSGVYTETELKINKSISLIGENSGSTLLNLQSTRYVGEPLYPNVPDLFPAPVWYDTAMKVRSDNFALAGFAIVTTGGDINITGNNNQIKNNILSAFTSVIGSNNQLSSNTIDAPLTMLGSFNNITENTFSENPSIKRLYDYDIAGSHCNFSSNSINGGDVNFAGTYGIISFNNVTGSFSTASDDCFFYKNFFSESGEFRVNGKNNIICKNVLDHYGSGLVIVGYNNKAMLNTITYCRIGISPSPDSIMYANYIAHNEWTINSRNAIINPYGNLSFLVHNNFVDNRYYQMWTMAMSNITDYLDNGREGNYWDIYHGEDNNSDGLGDSPFYLDSTHLDRYPLMNPFNLSIVEEVFPDWLIMPTINLVSPESVTYSIGNVSLTFLLNKQMTWIGYSLDGMENKTITGNLTLIDLPFGIHNLTVYFVDAYGNQGASQTINFTIEEPFPTLLIATVSVFTVSIVLIGLLLFRRHRKLLPKDEI